VGDGAVHGAQSIGLRRFKTFYPINLYSTIHGQRFFILRNVFEGQMFAMFLFWVALLAVLFMVMAAPLPDRLKAFGLVAAVSTVWLLWALYGVELLADVKWPQHRAGTAVSESSDGPTARLGQVGDLFGGVNALFAALAFAGVGIAAYQQWKSTQLAFKQSIEATFFSAVELHHRIADSLRFDRVRIFPTEHDQLVEHARRVGVAPPVPAEHVSGRQVFVEVIRAISYGGGDGTGYANLARNYRTLQNQHNYVLGHYFRNLYQILKLIDGD
jgi:hypothetical protein